MSDPQKHATVTDDRVPWKQLIAYGAGGVIPIALFNIAGQLMGLLGNISLGLSAFWLGTIMIIPRLWDAISDPVMGHLSDNTRSRWGRRRPYLFIGGIAVALSFAAMWWVPRGETVEALFSSEAAYNWFQLSFILASLLLFFTACTIFEIPHGALGMEMSADYHERTRLFSAKSFMGNFFAMGTPWLFWLAGRELIRGPGGDLIDGMRFVSLFIAAMLIPMSFWWFRALKEPGFAVAKQQKKSDFWKNMKTALSNKTFLGLVVIIFALAMAFDIVTLFGFYITIFYLYEGDAVAAGPLLGIAGTTWGITGLLAVFPLNWLSQRVGKNKTLLIAILLMCAAQVSKIVCYDPEMPYLILIPTVLLSSGMLMFFTLGASMVGDICDEDELHTNTRSEGSYYSVYWWFIKTGRAFASFATGLLLLITSFDEIQNVTVDDVRGSIQVLQAEAERWQTEEVGVEVRISKFDKEFESAIASVKKLDTHLEKRMEQHPELSEHTQQLMDHLRAFRSTADALQAKSADIVTTPSELVQEAKQILEKTTHLKKQAPSTLFHLRFVEIGLPLVLSTLSIWLTLRYPLTEKRCYEIKAALEKRHADQRS